MAITKDTFNKAKAPAASADQIIERLNAALEGTCPEDKTQYGLVKPLITNREVAVLKQHFEIEGYVSAHQMCWDLINAYNA